MKSFFYGIVFVWTISVSVNLFAVDTSGLGSAGQAAMGASAGVSAGDAAAGGVDCSCLSKNPPVPCPKGVAGKCALVGSNIADMLQSLAMMASSGATKGAVDGSAGDFDPNAFKPKDWSSVNSKFDCSGSLAETYVCQKDGDKKIKADLAKLNDLKNSPVLGEVDPKEIDSQIKTADEMLGQFMDGDYGSVLSGKGGGGNPSSPGSATLASINGHFTDPSANASQFGKGSSGDYNGIAGITASRGTGKVGPVGASLGNVEWNGSLDMVDSQSGKSLTLWERATRRYMGTPDGKRGFSMARIEFLRSQSPSLSASDNGAAPKVAKADDDEEEDESEDSDSTLQVQMSASQFLGH